MTRTIRKTAAFAAVSESRAAAAFAANGPPLVGVTKSSMNGVKQAAGANGALKVNAVGNRQIKFGSVSCGKLSADLKMAALCTGKPGAPYTRAPGRTGTVGSPGNNGGTAPTERRLNGDGGRATRAGRLERDERHRRSRRRQRLRHRRRLQRGPPLGDRTPRGSRSCRGRRHLQRHARSGAIVTIPETPSPNGAVPRPASRWASARPGSTRRSQAVRTTRRDLRLEARRRSSRPFPHESEPLREFHTVPGNAGTAQLRCRSHTGVRPIAVRPRTVSSPPLTTAAS